MAARRAARKRALDGVSLAVHRGELFGLLGPNGAGKSTLINIMAGLVNKTSGTVRIWDIDLDRDPRGIRAAIGVVPQELNLDAFFTPRELLDTQAGLYGVPRAERRTDEILRAVGLADKADAYARTLSGGMRRRLLVAKALVHAPPVLVLDEPTAGVDVELRQHLWSYVRELNASGTTVVLTTHYLPEAEELCDRIAIINHGKLVALDTKKALIARLDSKTLHVTLDRDLAAIPPALAAFNPHRDGPRRLTFRYQPSQMRDGRAARRPAGGGCRGARPVDRGKRPRGHLPRADAAARRRQGSRMIARRRLLALLAAAALASCAPRLAPMGPVTGEPRLLPDSLVMADGAALPLKVWLPRGRAEGRRSSACTASTTIPTPSRFPPKHGGRTASPPTPMTSAASARRPSAACGRAPRRWSPTSTLPRG